MKRSQTLALLQSIAANKADEAARRFANAQAVHVDAQSRLQMLNQLQDEYASRLDTTLSTGTGIAQWQNFRQFIGKVERAVDGQSQIVSDAQAHSLREQQAWQQQKRQQQSFEALMQRTALQEARRQQKLEQKSMDEFAANAARQRDD